jgi:hypothetical protein
MMASASSDPFVHSLIGAPLPPVLLSTYLSDSCWKGRLFDSRTFNEKSFDAFLDEYVAQLIGQVIIPDRFAPEAVALRFRTSIDSWSAKYKDAVKKTDPEEARSVKKTIRTARDGGEDGLDKLIEFLKKDEFPPILWVETKRAKLAYLDSLEFMMARMEKWFDYAPRYKSQTKQRSMLAKSMLQPFRPLFHQFGESMRRFTTMFVFMEVWTSNSETELFSEKDWSMEGVDRRSFDNAFEPMIEVFHQSISSLREAYFANTGKSPVGLGSGPVADALRQIVVMAEVS